MVLKREAIILVKSCFVTHLHFAVQNRSYIFVFDYLQKMFLLLLSSIIMRRLRHVFRVNAIKVFP